MSGMSEADLQTAVLDLCRLRHVLVHHCRPSLTQSGRWATAIQGDGGFPDLVLAGTRGVLFRELKSAGGRLSPQQRAWLEQLDHADDVAVWRPEDLVSGRIQREIEAIR